MIKDFINSIFHKNNIARCPKCGSHNTRIVFSADNTNCDIICNNCGKTFTIKNRR